MKVSFVRFFLGVLAGFCAIAITGAEQASLLRIGSVLPLEGDIAAHGSDLHMGIAAALKDQQIQGKTIEWLVRNDFYNPVQHKEEVKQLIEMGVVSMIGNVGTISANQSLPLLAEADISAIGFWADYDVVPQVGRMINFRPGVVEELVQILELAVSHGIAPTSLCGLSQGRGTAVYSALQRVYAQHEATKPWVSLLEEVKSFGPPWNARNGMSSVAVFMMDQLSTREAYQGLKEWETLSGHECRFIVTAGAYRFIAEAIRYFRYHEAPWLIAVASTAAIPSFGKFLANEKLTSGILVNSAVPSLLSEIPLVVEARQHFLPNEFNETVLEGFIVGKLFLDIANRTSGDLRPETVINAINNEVIDLGGVTLDFREREGQQEINHRSGRHTVFVNQIDASGKFIPIPLADLPTLFQ